MSGERVDRRKEAYGIYISNRIQELFETHIPTEMHVDVLHHPTVKVMLEGFPDVNLEELEAFLVKEAEEMRCDSE